jgi:hypothetical protein
MRMTKYPKLEALVMGAIIPFDAEMKKEILALMAENNQMKARVEILENAMKDYTEKEVTRLMDVA